MSKTPDARVEEQEQEHQRSDPTTAAAEPTATTKTDPEPSASAKPITPAEYIYESMIPLKPTSEETEFVSPLGKRERCNTGESSASGGRMMSMDLNFLKSEDIALDGGLGGLTSDDVMVRLKSAEVVQDLILPDTAATAAAALKAEQPPQAQKCDEKPSSREEDEDKFCPIVNLTAKLERISTGDEVAPLSENFRISSRDWVKDFEGETSGDLGPMHPSLFMDQTSNANVQPSAPPLEAIDSYEEYNVPIQSSGHQAMPPIPPLSNSNVIHNLPQAMPTRSSMKAKSPSSSTTSKKKRRKKRTIDISRAVEPTDNDVLFGRGGYTNTHLGNIKFRKKAMELRPWYEQPTTSKEEKYRISDLLVESVKSEGHRFLEKGEDGLWHEVIGNGARKKASQALRERIKGTRRSGGNASSIRSAGSTGAASNLNVEDVIGDLMPATVEGV